tara:strand:+ start:298 stop:1854 length:1557 start_codon:yes stop_codon:yes gene_type:complete
MKKTVTINLGGIIFHIDEDAFERLNTYLSSIKLHYNEEEGCEEIASDIEARIAELLQEKNIEIISTSDVVAIIEIMGEPERYEQEDEEPQKPFTSESTSKNTKKRIYRDKDNEVIGGVCSGIAAYFTIDPVIIRLLAIVGMFAGGGVLVYLILWAIIPEAKTTAQKLQMKGETVNAENIKKTIQKEFDNLKTSVDNFDPQGQKNKVTRFFRKIISFSLNLISYLFKFIGKFFGVIFLIMGISLCFMIVANLFGTSTNLIHINGNNINPLNLNQFFPLLFDGSKLSSLSIVGIILLVGIPVVQIIWLAIRILFSIPKQSTTTRTIMASLWIMGIISLFYVGSKTASNFSSQSYVNSSIMLDIQSDTLSLELSDNTFFNTHQKNTSYHFDEELNSLLTTEVYLKIKPSKSSSYQLEIKKSANGDSQKQAKVNANKIDYDYLLQENTLNFSNYLSIEPKEGFRFQEIELILYVPEGKTIYLDNSVKYFIFDVDNTSDTYDERMVNHYWKMTNGELNCNNYN